MNERKRKIKISHIIWNEQQQKVNNTENQKTKITVTSKDKEFFLVGGVGALCRCNFCKIIIHSTKQR